MITLQVNGREKNFSEEVLTSIVEKHFSQFADRPTEGKGFAVNPLAISQKLFEEKRKNSRQEATRLLILEAFKEMKKNPKYAKPFKTMMPKKIWESKNVGELKELSSKLGDHNANWVEQALEWAQRIANGETWEAVCNDADTANWNRLVVWKNGYYRLVGGSRKCYSKSSASYVSRDNFGVKYKLNCTVPLVVAYQ